MTDELLVADDLASAIAKVVRAELAARADRWAQNVDVIAFDAGAASGRRVLIRDDGGSRIDFLRDQADITANVWGTGFEDAKRLAEFVRGVLAIVPGRVDSVAAVETLTRPSEIPGREAERYIAATYIQTTSAI